MTEWQTGRHGLESFLSDQRSTTGGHGLSIVILSDRTYVNLRGDAQDSQLVDAAEGVMGQPLPIAPNTMSKGDHSVYWLGPDEWLVATAEQGGAELMAKLTQAMTAMHAAVIDVSGGNIVLRVSGTAVREVLSKGCTLDFHPDVFKVGMCAQSGLAKSNVLIACVDERPVFDVVVRRSFSEYLALWLRHSAAIHGVNFTTEEQLS